MSAGFEMQMRGYVNAIWARLGELEGKLEGFEFAGGWSFCGRRRGEGGAGTYQVAFLPQASVRQAFDTLSRVEAAGVSRRAWFSQEKKRRP